MEKQEINVSEELDKLGNEIGKIIVGSTQDEAVEVKKEINRLVQNVEEILVSQAGIPRGNARRIIENMQESLNYSIGRNLTGTREAEYTKTKENLSTVEKTELQATSDELSRFQCEGVALKNNKYCNSIEKVCEEIIHDYRRKLGNMGTRGAEDAYFDIKNRIGRTSNNLQEIHKDYSEKIKQDISNKVGELGLKITASISTQIEQTVEAETKENLSDFEKTLQGSTVSQEELVESDAGELTDNESKFKDVQQPNKNKREELEIIFK